jgi:chemotaxis protein methyltransferase CheR
MAFTFFFRDAPVLEAAVEHTAHELLGRAHAKVWDAGCASGPEPFTLAILLARRMGPFGFRNLRIDATDLDESGDFGDTIRTGVYPSTEVDRLPPGILEEFFEPAGPGRYRAAALLRDRIQFSRHDLLSLRETGSGYSLVVCKNVLLHFTAAERAEVVRMFHRALAPGGYLAVEQTQSLPEETSRLFERVQPAGSLFRKV